MNRVDRINRQRRLDRALSPRRGALPADVEAILALSPDVYLDLRYPSLPGIGQVLHQDAARTTDVTEEDDPIGSVLNLGSLGGFATSSGTQRPLFVTGFDGADDIISFLLEQAQPFSVSAWVDNRGDSEVGRRVYSIPDPNPRGAWIRLAASNIRHNHGITQDVPVADLATRGQFRFLSIASGAADQSLIQAADAGGVIGSNTGSSGNLGFADVLDIGNNSDGERPFGGLILALALFGRRLTAGEISTLPAIVTEP